MKPAPTTPKRIAGVYVQTADVFQAVDHGQMHGHGQPVQIVQNAVDTEADQRVVPLGFDVDIAGALPQGRAQQVNRLACPGCGSGRASPVSEQRVTVGDHALLRVMVTNPRNRPLLWKPYVKDIKSPVLRRYARMASSAAKGAVTEM